MRTLILALYDEWRIRDLEHFNILTGFLFSNTAVNSVSLD